MGRADIEFVHVNELHGEASTGAHLLEFDSLHGRWPHAVGASPDGLAIDGTAVGWSNAGRPGDVDWAALGVDVVLECTGRFRTRAEVQPHLERGARKVVIAAPIKGAGGVNVVVGVNDAILRPEHESSPPRRARPTASRPS